MPGRLYLFLSIASDESSANGDGEKEEANCSSFRLPKIEMIIRKFVDTNICRENRERERRRDGVMEREKNDNIFSLHEFVLLCKFDLRKKMKKKKIEKDWAGGLESPEEKRTIRGKTANNVFSSDDI